MTPTDDYVQSLPRKRMAAGALFTDEAGRVLLVDPVDRDTWDLPVGPLRLRSRHMPRAVARWPRNWA
jgi:hypothetical protein